MNPYLLIIILGIVEGITEFLPISSTGHMILVEKFINSSYFSKNFMDTFLVVVQLGAILAVVIYFWKTISPFVKDKNEFKKRFDTWLRIIIGVLPAVVIGLLCEKMISQYFMDSVLVVAATLIFYGIILIIVDKHFSHKNIGKEEVPIYKIPLIKVLIIGAFQCLAFVPGTSRSGATIIGGLLLGLTKGVAAEFSFLLAIPTMFGATFLKLIKNGINFSKSEWIFLIVGTLIAFVVAFIVIKWFMNFIRKKSFVPFGIYRIILGIVVLLATFLIR